MKIFYIILSTAATILITIHLSILIIEQILYSVKKYKESKQDLIKKYDSGYKEMYGTLNRAMNLKNDNSSYFEEKNLEELKEKINSRINAIKGN